MKALNLFFNNQTDFQNNFRFDDDYCKFADLIKKKAKEITIVLEIEPPFTYNIKSGFKYILWTKIWRQSGIYLDEVTYPNKEEMEGRSRILPWLKKFRYRYVPAIKGKDYFQQLLSDLHDVLSETVEMDIKKASKNFITTIKQHTKEISKSLSTNLKLSSSLELPTDLRYLFSTLDFETEKNNQLISINQRGDGLKTRHIPAILKFLADQEMNHQIQGSPKSTTIWGYEEPENSLELQSTFEMGEMFLEYSNSFQIFSTTHSPGIYSIPHIRNADSNKWKTYHVFFDDSQNESNFTEADRSLSTIDLNMGLMPLVTPYIVQKEIELKRQIEIIKEQTIHQFRIAVEGPTDEIIMAKAAKIFSDELFKRIENKELVFEYNQKGSGHKVVADQAKSHAYLAKQNFKLYAIFDSDKVALHSKRELDSDTKVIKAKETKILATFSFDLPKHLKIEKVKFYFGIEEIIKISSWKYAEKKGWLIPRNNFSDFCEFDLNPSRTIIDQLIEKGLNPEYEILIRNKIDPNSKKDFAKYLESLNKEESLIELEFFENLIKSINLFFK